MSQHYECEEHILPQRLRFMKEQLEITLFKRMSPVIFFLPSDISCSTPTILSKYSINSSPKELRKLGYFISARAILTRRSAFPSWGRNYAYSVRPGPHTSLRSVLWLGERQHRYSRSLTIIIIQTRKIPSLLPCPFSLASVVV